MEHGGEGGNLRETRDKERRSKGKGQFEQREGVVGNTNLGLGLEKNILFILVFFFSSAGLIESIRFNRFQTLKTKPTRNFFMIF